MILEEEFLELQKKIKPELCVEIGAYEAGFSKKIHDLGICDNIYAYEASPYVYQNFKDGLSEINYINLALADYDGNITFNVDKDKDPSVNTTDGIKHKRDVANFDQIQVKCSRLDSIHKSENICLWIDVEGASMEVLKGSLSILHNVSSIYIETETAKYWEDQYLHKDIVELLGIYDIEFYKWEKQHTSQYNSIFINNRFKNIIVD